MEKIYDIYENYYVFGDNLDLVFFTIIRLNKYDKIYFIKDHIDEFKKFTFEKFLKNSLEGINFLKILSNFLTESNLISYFNKEELKQIYMENPYKYFTAFAGKYLTFIDDLKNDSPMIRVNGTDDTMVHIQYHDYDFFEGKPIAFIKKQDWENKPSFLYYFLCNNDSVVKFYKGYYKSYLKIIKESPEKNNLEDFIKMLLIPNNLLNIFNNSKFSWGDLHVLMAFAIYYGDEKARSFLEKLRADLRKKNLDFYNEIVLCNKNLEKLEVCLKKYGLHKDNIYSYIIENKFLYSKEKGALLNIINYHYGSALNVLDILLLLDEMLTREMTIDEILKEKEIPKKEFQKIYQSSMENNPILYNYIFESLSKNSRRGFLKIMRLGYKVLNTPISSLEEYEQVFQSKMSIYDLLFHLENTSLYPSLLEKCSSWEKFHSVQIKKKKIREG